MNQILNNILRPEQPQKLFCWIVKPLGPGRYQVRDSSGRLLSVDATDTWAATAGVTVSDGRIVGKASVFKNPKIYEV